MTKAALQEDYLFMGPLLKARLQERVPDIPVDIVETREQVLAADRRARVLMVMWAGERFGDTAARGSTQLTQLWLVLLGLADVSVNADARNTRAGPLLSLVHMGLVGWTPMDGMRAMRRATQLARPDITKTKALYPLAFEIDMNL